MSFYDETLDANRSLLNSAFVKEKRWSVETNKHKTCRGNEWGWIEGASGNLCWSNDAGSRFTKEDANRKVADHNALMSQVAHKTPDKAGASNANHQPER